MPHVVIGHRLSSIFKSPFFRLWQLHRNFSRVVCVCRAQLDFAVNELGLSESRVDFVYDKVDHHFFHPLTVNTDDYILAVGREQRDYQTLSRALSGTGLKLIIVASSPWSTYRPHINKTENVTVLSRISYQALRDLYARARLVVVPLFEVDHAAGVNTLLEALAMGKPAIVSRTQGITDYVTDRETGIYVSPGAVAELRDAILSLWEHPGEVRRLGENGRQAVEEDMNLDTYVNKIVQIVYETGAVSQG
jgi:glycosyltransferase involved in cell wall biosynthesis